MQDDIIAAIATARQEAALSIIRLSGEGCIQLVNGIFTGQLKGKPSHTITYGFIHDHGKRIDEVLVSIFRGPGTFTAEDMVEISCHGGIHVTQRVLQLCLSRGARLAQRGEFSKRAFLNGRIDLTQAEAIADLVSANTDLSMNLALNGVRGKVSALIKDLKEDLIKVITAIEVNIDYPEYEDAALMDDEEIRQATLKFKDKIDEILERAVGGQMIKDGIKTAIVGRPNVGKSSLLNAFLEEDKAIVTDIPGTTRDIVEGRVNLDGVVLRLVDTAGIRHTEDQVERIGVERSMKAIQDAQLVLLVLDRSAPLTAEDQELLDLTANSNRIVVLNKADLPAAIDMDGVLVSALNQDIDDLTQAIIDRFDLGSLKEDDAAFLSNIRHIQLMEQCQKAIIRALEAMDEKMPADLVVIDLYDAWHALKEILGEEASPDLLDELFSRFCIGK